MVVFEFVLKLFEFNVVRFGFTFVSPPDKLEFVEFNAASLLIPLFILFKSCPILERPLLILFEAILELKLEFMAFKGFKLGFIAVNPVLILGRPRLRRGFDVVITFEVRDVRLVFKSDNGSPILRPTPKVGVAGGRPIPVPDVFIVP